MAEEKKKVALDNYVEVAERIAEVRGDAERVYPGGSFQPWDKEHPYRIETIGDQTYVAVVAAFYRTPDDPCPGVGSAWEVVPGRTSFTKFSELQNAETSAWGRALVAALAADTKRGIASADEVRLRTASAAAKLPPADFARAELLRMLNQRGVDSKAAAAKFAADNGGADLRTSDNAAAIDKLSAHYGEMAGGKP